MRIGGEERWIAAEDAGLYRDAFGAVPPGGLPAAFLEAVEEPLARLARRYARTHGPFTTREVCGPLRRRPAARCCASSSARGDLVRGELRPGGTEREWCDPEVLRRLRRASLATLRRRSSRPSSARSRASCPSGRASTARRPAARASTACARCSCRSRAWRSTPEVWERDVLPRRVGAYSPAWLDQLCASGELVWVGAGALGRNSGRVALLLPRGRPLARPAAVKGERPAEPASTTPIRERLERGAASGPTCWSTSPRSSRAELQEALWDLAWAGEVTNDAFAPLRAPQLSRARKNDRAGRPPLRAAPPSAARRRSRAAGRSPRRCSRARPRTARACARSRSCCSSATASSRARRCSPRASRAASRRSTRELANLETLGTARRGYFVEGLGGAQFALLGGGRAAARAAHATSPPAPLVLAATDPANPYGATLPWPKREDDESTRRPARVPGAYVVTLDAEPVLYVERGGKGLLALREPDEDWLRPALEALAGEVRRGRIPRLGIERFDGEPVVGSEARQRC